jgi:hypothetical protein
MSLGHGASIVRNGLVLHIDAANRKSYPGTGTTCTNLSNTSNSGTLTNGTTYSNTNRGLFNFDGTNDLISIPHNAAQNPTSITISSWVRPSSLLKNSNIVGKTNNAGYRYRVNTNGSVTFFDRGATNALTTATGLIIANNWYNIAVTGDATGLQIFINGVFIISNAVAFGGNTSSGNLALGAEDVTASFSESLIGSISQVSIYNRVLTGTEMQQNFNAIRGRYNI